MSAELQSWLALGVVAIAAIWLVQRWWRRRGHEHEGCDCPGARGNPDLARIKKKLGRR
ncbi:MAG: hypothetical protein IAE82_19300 [Opitutaceae bacterium]|nr:hypothetical protein [Opitutaceae bacterium]